MVEAGARSGSLNTAGHAAALGRPLGAVPGPVTSAASAGTHRLLREYDARCVTSTAEVLELLDLAPQEQEAVEARTDERTRVLDALSRRAARTAEAIAARAGLSVARTEAELGLLLLAGRADRDDAGWRSVAT